MPRVGLGKDRLLIAKKCLTVEYTRQGPCTCLLPPTRSWSQLLVKKRWVRSVWFSARVNECRCEKHSYANYTRLVRSFRRCEPHTHTRIQTNESEGERAQSWAKGSETTAGAENNINVIINEKIS